jgi:uncharacterized membrane protein YjgN (DUF898 family)
MQASLYAVLGVPSSATIEEIHAAYSKALDELRARIGRPDEPSPEVIDSLREAYVTLGNPDRRARYDRAQSSSPADLSLQPVAETGAAATSRTTAPSAVAGEETRHWFEFTGDGGSYFRIWIVNLFLSIVTLGIYSAWAKVRREQYFHRNLRLDGASFDYHGEPMAILKGRLIAASFFVVLSLAQNLSPVLYLILVVAAIPLVPWLMVKAYRFRAHNTSYRGLRFSFDGSYREAFKVFVGYWLLMMVTLGLCLPLWIRAQQQFIVNHLSFGRSRFQTAFGIWPIYRIFLIPMLFGVAALIALGIAFGGLAASVKGSPDPAAVGGFMAIYFVVILAGMLLIGPYLRVHMANLVWNATSVGPHYTQSAMRLFPYAGIVISNFLLTLLTLGFFQPWAKVRIARYRAEAAALVAQTSLDEFIAGEQGRAAAVGEEMADMFDFDVAL